MRFIGLVRIPEMRSRVAPCDRDGTFVLYHFPSAVATDGHLFRAKNGRPQRKS
jgi:hypothetical protein